MKARVPEPQARAGALFERIAAGEAPGGWSVVGAPGEALRAPPRRRDVLLIDKRGATGALSVRGAAGDWLLVEDAAGRYWAPVLERGRVREGFAIARRRARVFVEQATPTPLPVLNENTPVTLPNESDLPALKTALRLESVAPTTRSFLSSIVRMAATNPGADVMSAIKIARDALNAGVSAQTVPRTALTATKQLISLADAVHAGATMYGELLALSALADIAALPGADAMAQLARGHDAFADLFARSIQKGALASKATATVKLLAKVSTASALTAHARELSTRAASLSTWLRTIGKGRPWSKELRRFVAAKRPGGTLDGGHLKPARYTDKEVAPDAKRLGEWDMIDAADVLGDSLKTLARANLKATLTDSIRQAFSAAFRSGRAGSPPDAIVEPCVAAIVAAFPVLENERAALKISADRLIRLIAGDLGVNSGARARVERAKGAPATKAFAEDLLAAAALWPFDGEQFLSRTMRVFDHFAPGFDIFALVGEQLVNYNFFGQDLITISPDLVAPLAQAELHYFGLRARLTVPSFVVARETGAFNFRLARPKVMRTLLHHQAKGLFVHTVGRAIDINYPDQRNPHVTQPKDIWLPVNATLALAAAQATQQADIDKLARVAAINFGARGKREDILYDILEASRQFVLSFARWEREAPQGFVVPQTRWISASEYRKSLSDAELDLSSKPIRSAIKARDAAVAGESKARAQLIARAGATAKVWRANLDNLRKREKQFIALADQAPQMARLRAAIQAANRAELQAVDEALKELMTALGNKKERAPELALRAAEVVARADVARARAERAAQTHGIDLTRLDARAARGRTRWRSERDYFEGMVALLPKSASALADAQQALASAVGETDRARAEPLLEKYLAGQRELRLIGAFHRYLTTYRRWGRQGFTDHDPVFLWAMKRADFTWGAEFESPDLHHFEIKKGLNWSANW
jgi:hypothetical protein